MLANRYGRIKSDEDWLHPRLVGNALDLLEKEIPVNKNQIGFVHLSFTTDPFMYDLANKRVHPHVKSLTLQIIQKLNQHGVKATVLTKGLCPEELSDKATYGSENWYGITLVSLDPAFQKQYEPFASPSADRIKSLELLHQKGLQTWVSIEPYPTPNIVKQNLKTLLERVAFVDAIIFGKMNYNKTANGFNEVIAFYKASVDQVRAFCDEKKIKCHIKEGTPGSISSESQIFSGCDVTE